MVLLRPLLALCSAALAVLAAPTDLQVVDARSNDSDLSTDVTITTSQEGTTGGVFFSCFIQSNTGGTMNINGGSYTLSWSPSVTDIVAGIGWATGAARSITYSGSFSPSGNAYLSVYGWTTNPLVEYYITDSFGTFNPSTGATHKGTVTTDGGTYDIYMDTRVNQPSIQGTATFNQYLSVRQAHRVGGTVTTANHFNAWKSLGLAMGTFNYQIVATEGFESSGSSSITVSGL